MAHGHGEASAVGKAGDPNEVSRTNAVTMLDTLHFSPADISSREAKQSGS